MDVMEEVGRFSAGILQPLTRKRLRRMRFPKDSTKELYLPGMRFLKIRRVIVICIGVIQFIRSVSSAMM